MKKSKNIYYIICSPDLNGCPPLSYLIVSDLTERTFLSGGGGGGGVPEPPPPPPPYAPVNENGNLQKETYRVLKDQNGILHFRRKASVTFAKTGELGIFF